MIEPAVFLIPSVLTDGIRVRVPSAWSIIYSVRGSPTRLGHHKRRGSLGNLELLTDHSSRRCTRYVRPLLAPWAPGHLASNSTPKLTPFAWHAKLDDEPVCCSNFSLLGQLTGCGRRFRGHSKAGDKRQDRSSTRRRKQGKDEQLRRQLHDSLWARYLAPSDCIHRLPSVRQLLFPTVRVCPTTLVFSLLFFFSRLSTIVYCLSSLFCSLCFALSPSPGKK